MMQADRDQNKNTSQAAPERAPERYLQFFGELQWETLKGSGPGGQHRNKTETYVRAKFRLADSKLFTEQEKSRIRRQAEVKTRTHDGIITYGFGSHKSQFRNKTEAAKRLLTLLDEAKIPPKRRRKTKPSAASKRRVKEAKQRHSKKKDERRKNKSPEI